MNNNLFQIRATGILVEYGKILLVKQNVSSNRAWSLPGGRLEVGESLEQGIVREMAEETGVQTRVVRLLYLCDKPDSVSPILHITFLMERLSGELTLPTNEFDENPIHDVRMVPIGELTQYGFSEKFKTIVLGELPEVGSYCGHKQNIGL